MAMLYDRKPLNENMRTCLLCYIRTAVLQGALYFYNVLEFDEKTHKLSLTKIKIIFK